MMQLWHTDRAKGAPYGQKVLQHGEQPVFRVKLLVAIPDSSRMCELFGIKEIDKNEEVRQILQKGHGLDHRGWKIGIFDRGAYSIKRVIQSTHQGADSPKTRPRPALKRDSWISASSHRRVCLS